MIWAHANIDTGRQEKEQRGSPAEHKHVHAWPAWGHRRLLCSPQTFPWGWLRRSWWEQMLLCKASCCVHERLSWEPLPGYLSRTLTLKKPLLFTSTSLGLGCNISEQGVGLNSILTLPKLWHFREHSMKMYEPSPTQKCLVGAHRATICPLPSDSWQCQGELEKHACETETSLLICFITLLQPWKLDCF